MTNFDLTVRVIRSLKRSLRTLKKRDFPTIIEI